MEPPYLSHALKDLALPHTLACAYEVSAEAAGAAPAGAAARRLKDNTLDYTAGRLAIENLFAGEQFPAERKTGDLLWRRDPLGKPFVEWTGSVAAWAKARGLESRSLQVSNTHDGGAHLVLAAYGKQIAGIGVDAVWMPRLLRPGKDERYLHRFARQFMSSEEYEAYLRNDGDERRFLEAHPGFQVGADKTAAVEGRPIANEALESLRVRTAAHFSLMESASKACGTGLKIGAGMGRETSLPKQSLGVLRLFPQVELLCSSEARARLTVLGAVRYEACIARDGDFLISAVALYSSGDRGRTF